MSGYSKRFYTLACAAKKTNRSPDYSNLDGPAAFQGPLKLGKLPLNHQIEAVLEIVFIGSPLIFDLRRVGRYFGISRAFGR